ncbi:MAG: hypothetical protein ACQESR_14110 [Planctomycetota bacterium]
MAKPRFFQLDADLWHVPGPLKMDWPTPKLAIYLREATSHHDDPACYRTRKRIRQDLGLSDRVLSTSLQRLKQWPNKTEPFLVVEDDGEIILRPLPNRKVQVFRCLWDSELPDSYKDILLFAWSQYRGDVATGSHKQHVYALNLCGQKAPSILRCCYISRQRGTTFKKLIRKLRREIESYGFVEVLFPATSKRPAIIAGPDEARPSSSLERSVDDCFSDCLPKRSALSCRISALA